LPANTLHSDPESAVVHDRNSVAATKRRTMDFRQTARCVLTGCLSPGGRSKLNEIIIVRESLLPQDVLISGKAQVVLETDAVINAVETTRKFLLLSGSAFCQEVNDEEHTEVFQPHLIAGQHHKMTGA
ncbi:MAG: hypothetical protein P4L56_07180, partial [Candidatus Sulfopaludibacter sp.]|nr:hypothetical protein [Candidatus Sulfopaludibacter sp.]